MNHRGFINILVVLFVIAVVATIGYSALVKQANSPTTAENQTSTPPVAEAPREPNLDLISPSGAGESFSVRDAINITYKVGSDFASKLSETDKVELYLLNEKNVLFGYIGKVDVKSTFFTWNPQQLRHNGGMDFSVAATPPGKYRILLVARPAYQAKCGGSKCPDYGIDTLDSPLTKYVDGKIFHTDITVKPPVDALIATQPLGVDLSSELFTLK